MQHTAFGDTYTSSLVALSFFIAVLAGYTALALAIRVTLAEGSSRLIWLSGGAIAMGTGIWAVHYIGMQAFHLPVAMQYDWPTVLLSILAAVAASGIALRAVCQPSMGPRRAFFGSLFMGLGISAMHYIGMAAMRIPARQVYSPPIVILSIALAILTAYVALRLTFAFRGEKDFWSLPRAGSAFLIGLAIPVMHYVGMAAVTFIPQDYISGGTRHILPVSGLGTLSIVGLTFIILATAVCACLVDRRLRRQAQALVESRRQLQVIFDSMADGIVVLDPEGNLIQFNSAAQRLIGLTPQDFKRERRTTTFQVLSPSGEIIPPDRWPSSLALKDHFVQYAEFEIRKLNFAKVAQVEVSTAPIKSSSGKTIQIIISFRDISDRKQNLSARARLAEMIDASEDAIAIMDRKGIIRSWNNAAQKTFGYTASKVIGQSVLMLVPGQRIEEARRSLERVLRGETIDHLETERKRKDGKLVFVSLTITPLRDEKNNIIGATKTARDITSRKRMEQQLYQSQKMEAIGQLTGGIAHDFNNLLGVIIGNLELLEKITPADQKAAKFAATAQKAAWRGADLIRRLLSFSSDQELHPKSVSLNESVHNLVDMAARALGPDITIITQLDSTLPPVCVDLGGLESALLNVAVNARDAMPGGGTLTISTELRVLDELVPPVATGQLLKTIYACVSLTDTGHGMSPETLARVFEPFFTTKPRGKGTGLGLAMVYGFARQSQGTALIYSEIGYGTTVTLYLPLADHHTGPVASIPQRTHTAKLGSIALIVDDEQDLLDIACAYLTDMGYECLQAVNAFSALEIVRLRSDLEIVITDVVMPGGMNGVELAQQIRKLIPHIRIIYSSGYSADALAERSGAVVQGALLRKPYQRAEFFSAVSIAMERAPETRESTPA